MLLTLLHMLALLRPLIFLSLHRLRVPVQTSL